MRRNASIRRMTILSVVAAATPIAALAEEPAVLDRFYVSTVLPSQPLDFRVRWDYDDEHRGSDVNYRRDLDMPGIFGHPWEIGATFADAHRFEAFGLNVGQESLRTTSKPVVVHGNGITAGSRVSANLDIDMKGLAYTWFFERGERHAFGIGVGAVQYELSSRMDFIVGGFPGDFVIDQHFDEDVVMPMARAEYVRTFAGKWRFGADASYLHRGSGDTRGHGMELNAGIEFLLARHVSLAVRYNETRVDLDLEGKRPEETSAADPDYSGAMHIRQRGPKIVASLRF